MPEITQQKNLIFTCPSCAGRGQLGHRPCPVCQSQGLYFWFLGRLLYWGQTVSQQDIWQEKINKFIKVIFIIIFGLFAFWGLFSFVTFILESIRAGFLWEGLISFKDVRLLIFWLSVWVDLYLYYRLSKTDPEKEIHAFHFKGNIVMPTAWAEVIKIPRKSRLDISKSFSPEARQAIFKAFKVAKNLKHSAVEPLHLLAASLTFEKTATVFGRLGLPLKDIKDKISRAATTFFVSESGIIAPKLSPDIKKVFFSAYALAQSKRKKQVDLFTLLIALGDFKSPAHEVLYALEVEKDELRNVVLWVETAHELRKTLRETGFLSIFKPKSGMNRAMTAIATPIVNRFGSDLTLLARGGYLAPCVARDEVIDQIFQVAEAGKPGVILVGNPGTGRNAIVGGIATRMVTEKVPKILQDKRLVSLSLAALVSGATGSGTAEQRISTLADEVIRSGNIVLSVSDVHNMIGIQTTAGELDLSEILASAAAKSRFFIIATTTPPDYSKYLEGTALADTLEKIEIAEPKNNQAIQILEVASMPLEAKHQVFFSYDAVVSALGLSDRYLHERYLPEKAIAVLEEAALSVRKERGKNTIIQKQDIAKIVSQKSKVPLTQITEKESVKLLRLEDYIHEKLINQETAVKAVANALRRARAQLRDADRPIASFLFLGPTGVGKTELAKAVAAVYFGSEKNMLRLDMSEYQEPASIARLIGSPQEKAGGYLTEAVRQNPFALILLDELEKAFPEILNIFLQVMDDGRLTDGLGRTIDFTNTIIVATSNVGAQYIFDAIQKNEPYEKIKRNLIDKEIRTHYRPEFLNRLDEIIVFKPLSQTHLNQITILLLAEVVSQLESKGVKLEITEPAVIELAKAGFDPEFGARPLRRVIQERVTNTLAKYLIQGDIGRRDTVIYDVEGKITVKRAKKL